ncbi:MAG: hypothetical protein J6W96_03165 [Alphaproteobacteria bacterium]|nr:hypothetical protein [Alphaproteobacteria bacterium]
MSEKEEILKELKDAFPLFEIEMLSTEQRGNKSLIVVKGFSQNGNIDDWYSRTVYPIWWEMISILDNYKRGLRSFRLLFVRGNQFMLHSPNVDCGDVFREFKELLYKDISGYDSMQRYVGECRDINELLEYLTTTQIWF